MKLFGIILLIVSYSLTDNCVCQNDERQSLYMEAYEFIVGDEILASKNINVDRFLVPPCFTCFKQIVDDADYLYLLDQNIALQEQYLDDGEKAFEFRSEFRYYGIADGILYFSQIINNILVAKIQYGEIYSPVLYPGRTTKMYFDGLYYLIFFNDDGTISQHYKYEYSGL